MKVLVTAGNTSDNSLIKSLEVILHEHAFKSSVDQHTGSFHNASVTSSLAGMKLSLVRLQSSTLWEKGYNLLTSEIGFMVYDAPSNISTITSLTKVGLRPRGQPISVEFKNLSEMVKGRITKCAMFDENGNVSFSEMRFHNLCYTRNYGHFTIMLPQEARKKSSIWFFVVKDFVIGLFGVASVALVGWMVLGIFKFKKRCDMEREAEEEAKCLLLWQ
ncbi:hypothetical protein CQW23_32258 [Capsicum baccatum]|uniref:Uncharacterized protein n=1 Tax=Capsicum baccatum TaxID=33114 RepID=A0A2G2V585_CAPBA|nr:hypothetical protein CQW23_32258 [Capsicum baccatum]